MPVCAHTERDREERDHSCRNDQKGNATLLANGNDTVKRGCGGGEMALWLRVAAHANNPNLGPRTHTGGGLQHL